MMNFTKVIGIVLALIIAMPIYAESAPVYDAEDMSQMDAEFDQNQAEVPPPPPGQESAPPGQETFIPMHQQQAFNDASNLDATPIAPASTSLNMTQRMQRVEQQISNLQSNASAERINSLQDQVQSLRGQVELLSHQLEQLQNQQKNMISELDKRFTQLQQNASKVAIDEPSAKTPRKIASAAKQLAKVTATSPFDAPIKAPDNQPNVAEEQQIYQTAYNLIKSKKYNDAINVLQNMLQKYPSGQFASNAHYWLGELYGLLGKNDQALIEFGTVVKNYPDSPRISDAQLKVGLIYAAQFKWADAKNAFRRVINRYPGTTSARLASEQLKQIKQSGH